ncbi:GNAT family N-acetyltransferase [Sedimentitalea sp. XS_ASV28]|uniref:GNAT family N-acetyltransferase n=1 Tax=Sedimentitalea sp. XS_ASV28 TaxID=3241296 RepID=UPI0035192C7D
MQLFRPARPEDAARCREIEAAAYSAREAAPLSRIADRIATYPQGFLVVEQNGVIAGFINSGCAHDVDMADDAFKALAGHDPDAPNVVILSVAVDPAFQGMGLARALMQSFVRRMVDGGKSSIHLMCKSHYVPMYEKLGYRYVRGSASGFAGAAWHEMVMNL